MSSTNPWLGWSSYDENALDEGYRFVGRSAEISELFSLIDNNLLVTLYGKSGVGKSSILNAGVFPSLRAADYVPVVCRCNPSGIYPQSIIDQIKTQCHIESGADVGEYANLVEFFRNSSFTSGGKEVFPVLVLDQFEDWFRIDRASVSRILADISFLISGEYDGLTNYRFVISIREDYLYLLEDAIGNAGAPDLKQNRYRLTDLRRPQAEEILNLGDIDRCVKDRIIEIAGEGSGYNPGLLSFFCSELYNLYPDGIGEQSLKVLTNEGNLIETYYNRCFDQADISASTKKYIETHLQEDGLRRPQNLENVLRHIPARELEPLLTGNSKLLRKFPVGECEYVELIHDRIAEIINDHREKEFEIQRTRSLAMTLVFYFIPAGYLVWHALLRLLHACWGLSKHAVAYLSGFVGSANVEYQPRSAGETDIFIYSDIIAVALFMYFLIFVLPKCVCDYFYKKLRLVPFMAAVMGTAMAGVCATGWMMHMNVTSHSTMPPLLNSIMIVLCLLMYYVSTKRVSKHENKVN